MQPSSPFNIRIGTSGWSYPDWVGPFYPDGTPRGSFLRTYADRFRVVEVDATFYAVPAITTVEGWSCRLKTWAEVIREIASRRGVSAAYAFANNHFAGHAPETSRELTRLLQEA